MPVLPVVPDVVKWEIFWKVGNDSAALTRLHIKYSGSAPNGAACTAIASALYTDCAAEFASVMTAQNALTGVRITDLASSSGASGEHLATTVGTLSSTFAGASLAVQANLLIARRYRGGKPKSYLPLGDQSVLHDQQTWTSAFISNVNAGLAALVSDIAVTNSGGCSLSNLVNVSYYNGFTVRPSPPVPGVRARNIPTLRATPVVDDVSAWVAIQQVSSQRRRNLRRS